MPAVISAISTAVPPYKTKQSDLAEFMVSRLASTEEEAHKIRVIYRASGIRQRYSVIDDFFENKDARFSSQKDFPMVSERMNIYRSEAIGLAEKAATGLGPQVNLQSATHLIVVSCTGMYAPGLDIDLIQRLNLNSTTERTAIHFMGCYAAFNGLKTAKSIVESDPRAHVLLVCIELCSIHLQKDNSDDALLSNALFGDGAAAAWVTQGGTSKKELAIVGQHADLAPEGIHEMSWNIGDFGFEMKLSQKVPDVIKSGIKQLAEVLLKKVSDKKRAIDYYAIHPGGRRILHVIKEALHLPEGALAPSFHVLKEHGNMSSPTVLFVLKEIFDKLTEEDHNKSILSFAFGPGLTLESLLFDVHVH